MDRNSIIGFVLLMVLGAGYLFWNNHEQQLYLQQKYTDSVAMAANQKPIVSQQKITPSTDSLPKVDSSLPAAFRGTASNIALSNGDLSLQFSTKGGYPTQASLNNFKTYDGSLLSIFKGEGNKLVYNIPVNGKIVSTGELYFTPEITNLSDGGKQLRMTANVAPGESVVLDYAIPKSGYMVTANLRLIGMQQELATVQTIPVTWNTDMLHTEKDLKYERMKMQIHYQMKDGSNDYFTLSRTPTKSLTEPMQWLSVRANFFNSTIIANDAFKAGGFDAKEPAADSSLVASNSSALTIPVTASNNFSFGYRWYMGPNDYKILKSYNLGLDELIQLGYGPFFFVKYISEWMIIPIFYFLSSFIGSFGLIIICLTVIIRLLTSFFTYKSYLSTAKMRVLKPEIDEFKVKYGDNQQQMGVEQMKLYRTAGVNPLGGCLPMVLQMPFLLSVYYFIPTAIQLRQSHFLWCSDLSTYDSILNFGFSIPFYGSHISLFTLLMTASSLLLAIYNKNMTAAPGGNDQGAQMMKYMPYIMPIMFLGWFNSLPAGLTFYYAFSNCLSLLQQFVIQKFVIDEAKIHAKMKENRSKPASTSKWQQRLEEMQKTQAQKTKQQKK